MKSVQIENIKAFTTHLFVGETFDGFLVTEASFSTLFDLTIDGHMNKEFLNEEEAEQKENREGIVYWKRLRPLCYEIIKGQRVPLRFKLVFLLPPGSYPAFLSEAGLNYDPSKINGLFLNINFQDGKLNCTTGSSLKEFSLDRSLEQAWDERILKFLGRVQG